MAGASVFLNYTFSLPPGKESTAVTVIQAPKKGGQLYKIAFLYNCCPKKMTNFTY